MSVEALIYARFSTLEQAKGYSLERQILNGKAYIEQQGWQLFSTITDEGRSAYHGANRAAGSSLFQFEAEAREGIHRGRTLCVENIDRLSRQGAKAAAQLVWALNENGVDVATWNDGYVYKAGNSGDLMELFSVIIKAQMAYEESLKKSQRTSASWEKRKREIAQGSKSVLVGQTPAWIVEQDGRYVCHPDRQKVLNEIFDLYIGGMGTFLIVQKLNARGEPNWTQNKRNKGGGWYLGYVHRLLTSRAVLGEYTTLKGELISADYWPQAVSAVKFNRALDVRAGKRSTGGGNRIRSNNLLAGFVRCAVCEGVATYENKGANSFTTYKNKAGEVKLYPRKLYQNLRCSRSVRHAKCDNPTLLDYQVVEDTVLDRVLAFALLDDQIDPLTQRLNEQIAEAERLLAIDQQQIENLVDVVAAGGAKALVQRIVDLETGVEAKSIEIAAMKQQRDITGARPEVADDLALIALTRSELQHEDADIRYFARTQTNMALKRVMEGVFVNRDNTFTIWLADEAVWHCDAKGKVIGGQAL